MPTAARHFFLPLVLSAATMYGCTDLPFGPKKPATSKFPLDTIATRYTHTAVSPVLYEQSFVTGHSAQRDTSTLRFLAVDIGDLPILTGRIIACDPLHVTEYGFAFADTFPRGRFPVQLAVAQNAVEGRVAFARILFSTLPVKTWKPAAIRPVANADNDLPNAYSVDAGMGIFMDASARDSALMEDGTPMLEALYTAMNAHYRPQWRFAQFRFGQHQLAAFSTGFGDGRYQSFVGYDSLNRPCRLLTDFGLFPTQ